MSGPIRISELREWTRYPANWIEAPVGPEDVAALLDAVEAAYKATEPVAPHAASDNGRALLKALNRFDFSA